MPAAPKPVEAILDAPIASVRALVGQWATVEPVDEQRTRLRMTAENMDWPALALGSIGAEFEVITPPELVDHIREWGERFTRAVRVYR